MDDFPMGIFSDEDEALQFAKQLDWELPESLRLSLKFPACEWPPSVITLIAFDGGRPVDRDIVRTFWDE